MSDHPKSPVAALLELASSQLEVAVHSSETQVQTLAKSIATLMTLGATLKAATRPGTATDELACNIVEHARSALMAMQFHDALVQRVAHVKDSLTELNEALGSSPPAEIDWATVLAGIRFRYSMEDERMLFDRIIGAAACPDVNSHDSTHDSLRSSVELF